MLFMIATSLQASTILVLGDSLSAAYGIPPDKGWVSLLQQQLDEQQFTVINASVSGETTDGGLTRLPTLLQRHQPNIVLIQLGANDALRGLPIGLIRSNLNDLVTMSIESNAKVIIIGIRIPPNYGPLYTESFFNLYAEVADHFDLIRVPFLLENVALDWNLMQSDGLHPTADAQPIILDNVWPTLEPILSKGR